MAAPPIPAAAVISATERGTSGMDAFWPGTFPYRQVRGC
jgi:hypothetical protein